MKKEAGWIDYKALKSHTSHLAPKPAGNILNHV